MTTKLLSLYVFPSFHRTPEQEYLAESDFDPGGMRSPAARSCGARRNSWRSSASLQRCSKRVIHGKIGNEAEYMLFWFFLFVLDEAKS